MRSLNLNPTDHDFSFFMRDYGDGIAEISFKFGDAKGQVPIIASEAAKIGSWFQSLAVEIKRLEKAERVRFAKAKRESKT